MPVALAAIAVALALHTGASRAQTSLPPFDTWLAALREEALARGLPPSLLDRAFADVQPMERILERDRAQAEFTLDLDAYLKRRLTPLTIRSARRMHTQHRALLRKIEREYAVPSRVLISIWGLESNFGKFSGVRPTIPTLVTLAYDPRRASMFRNELFSALEIVDRGDIELERLKGSWAGALGQPQFMPSSYLEYAQDFDGDGRRDIWESPADVFASIAFFLQQHGWNDGQIWGREVRVPEGARDKLDALPRRTEGCRAERMMTVPMPLDTWRRLGVRTVSGGPLPKSSIDASLVAAGSRFYLV